MFNPPAAEGGREEGLWALWCITVTGTHQRFLHTSWPLLWIAGDSALPNSCAYYSATGDSDSRLEPPSSPAAAGALWERGGRSRMVRVEGRDGEGEHVLLCDDEQCGNSLRWCVSPRTGTYIKLWQWAECSTPLSMTKAFTKNHQRVVLNDPAQTGNSSGHEAGPSTLKIVILG